MKSTKQYWIPNTALLLVDIQVGLDQTAFYGGNRNNPNAELEAARILSAFRDGNMPVIHVRHSSTNPESPLHASKPGFEIKPQVSPLSKELVITKSTNNAFLKTQLDKTLHSLLIKKLVIVGLTTNHCVSTTARMAGNLGYHTIVISDATAAFDRKGIQGEHYSAELIHSTSLASLQDEFAEIISTNQLLRAITSKD